MPLELKIVVDDKGTPALVNMQRVVENLGKTASVSIGKQMIGSLKDLGIKVAATYLSFRALKGIITSLVNAGISQEKINKELAASMRLVGEYSRENYMAIERLADSIRKTTTMSDEAVKASAGMLMGFAGLSTEVTTKLIPALVDFAVFTGTDLQEVTTRVARTIVGKTNALSRLGIEVKKTGSAEEKALAITKQLNEMFGGYARTQIESTAGMLKQLGNSWGEVADNIGGFITQSSAVQFILKTTHRLLEKLAEETQRLVPGAKFEKMTRGELERTIAEYERRLAEPEVPAQIEPQKKGIRAMFLGKEEDVIFTPLKDKGKTGADRRAIEEQLAHAKRALEMLKAEEEKAALERRKRQMEIDEETREEEKKAWQERFTFKYEILEMETKLISDQRERQLAEAKIALDKVLEEKKFELGESKKFLQFKRVAEEAYEKEVAEIKHKGIEAQIKRDVETHARTSELAFAQRAGNIKNIEDEFDERLAVARLAADRLIDEKKREALERGGLDEEFRQWQLLAEQEYARESVKIEEERVEKQKSLKKEMVHFSIWYAGEMVRALGGIARASKANMLVQKRVAQMQIALDTAKSAMSAFDGTIKYSKMLGPFAIPLAVAAAGAAIAYGAARMAEVERQRMRYGGVVYGRGRRDTVPAYLTPGERVLSLEEVKKLGGYAAIDRAITGGEKPYVINIHGNFFGNREYVKELIKEIDREKGRG